MSREKEARKPRKFDLNSKFWRTSLFVLSCILTFAGPTYVVYALYNILEIDYAISMISGFALFTAGSVLIWYLIRRKFIS